MKSNTTILNFTGIYDHESFYLRDKSSRFVDLSDITGTGCMCDDLAKEEIIRRIYDQADDKNYCVPDITDNAGIADAQTSPSLYFPYGIHFMDNGNYHYMSAIFLERVKEPFSLMVLDHHPDMQRSMFDILSCGGWVLEVADRNEFVRDILVIGADNNLIMGLPLEDRKKAKFLGINDFLSGGSTKNISTEFPVYISIDKDVISRDELITNWDQGEASRNQVLSILSETLRTRRVLGIDICGECAPDQAGCDLKMAITENDEFNKCLLDIILKEKSDIRYV